VADWWHEKSLSELSASEWEALCDGCAKCCLHKVEDEDDGQVYYTKVHCLFLDERSCRCKDYGNRLALVPDCLDLGSADWKNINWLPSTCAYRLRANKEQLPQWHPLITGNRETVHEEGISIRGRSVSEEFVHVDGYEEHIVQWVE
jgi:uncharacterized protein